MEQHFLIPVNVGCIYWFIAHFNGCKGYSLFGLSSFENPELIASTVNQNWTLGWTIETVRHNQRTRLGLVQFHVFKIILIHKMLKTAHRANIIKVKRVWWFIWNCTEVCENVKKECEVCIGKCVIFGLFLSLMPEQWATISRILFWFLVTLSYVCFDLLGSHPITPA